MIEIARRDRAIKKDKLIIMGVVIANAIILISLNIFLITKFVKILTTIKMV